MIRIRSLIDAAADLSILPLTLTEHSKQGHIRALGIAGLCIWFPLTAAIYGPLVVILLIPLAIQESER